MSKPIDITVVVPVYNSVDTLMPVYERSAATLASIGKTFEVLFVEDGGDKQSWAELKRIRKAHPETVRLIRLSRNYGQNAATVCGIAHAKGDAVITMDDDLQTPPEEMVRLLDGSEEEDCEVVFGVAPAQQSTFIRRWGSRFLKRLFLWVDGSDIGSSFRFILPSLKQKLVAQRHDQLFLNQVIHWYTEDVVKVEVRHDSRQEGSSGYSFASLMGISFRLIFFYTDFPLRLMTAVGLLIAIVCFGVGAYFIYEKITIGTEPGFASIITAIFFSTGIIMICLSLLGAYISRIYADRIRKPVYSIKTIL